MRPITYSVAAVVLAIACAAIADAKPAGHSIKTVKSAVDITEGGPTHFEGVVTSAKPKCLKRRKVTLIYGQNTVVGSDYTNKAGNWELDGDFAAGEYHAVMAEKALPRMTCSAYIGVSAQF